MENGKIALMVIGGTLLGAFAGYQFAANKSTPEDKSNFIPVASYGNVPYHCGPFLGGGKRVCYVGNSTIRLEKNEEISYTGLCSRTGKVRVTISNKKARTKRHAWASC